jgi:hypothetical protein
VKNWKGNVYKNGQAKDDSTKKIAKKNDQNHPTKLFKNHPTKLLKNHPTKL